MTLKKCCKNLIRKLFYIKNSRVGCRCGRWFSKEEFKEAKKELGL